MKKFLLTMALLSFHLLAMADWFGSKTIEGVEMKFDIVDEEAKTCKVANYVMYANADLGRCIDRFTQGPITIPEQAMCEGVPYTVVGIGNLSFWMCENITKISIPKTIVEIDYSAFCECRNLKELVVEEGNPVFDSRNNCNAIIKTATDEFYVGCKGSVIPEGIQTIFGYSFYTQAVPTVLYIPQSVKEIDYGFLYNCNVEEIVVAEGNSIYDSRDNCNAIIETATNTLLVGGGKTVIPSTVSVIGSFAFKGRKNLYSIDIPGNVTEIYDGAFQGCSSLKKITLSEGITNIRYDCFQGCTSLQSVNIPASVKRIEELAFGECLSLDTVRLSDLESYLNISFAYNGQKNIYFSAVPTANAKHIFVGDKELSILEIPEGVTKLPDYVFYSWENLKAIFLPSTLETIGRSAFKGCKNLWMIQLASKTTPGMRDTEVFTFDKYNKQNNPVLCVPVGAANNYNRDLWTYLDIVEGETIIGEVGEDLNMIFKTNDTDDNSVSIGFGDKRVPTLIGKTDVTRLSLPDNIKDHQVTEIAPYAFQGYSKLKEVVIPASISAIGNYAFADCIGLRSVTTLIDLPFKLDQSVFQYSNTSYDKNTIYYAATLYVPLGRKNFYERIDYWNLFLNIEEKDVSWIESHATPTSSKEKMRFSIDGHRISTPCTGLNIIRYADGTTRKVFVK